MRVEKFNDLFHFAPKSNIRAGEGLKEGLYPFYTSSPKISKRINKAQVDENALVFGTGGTPSIHYAKGSFSTSADCIVAIPKLNDFNIKFVYYYIFGNIHLLERGFKGAGIQHISKKYIQNLQIPLLDLDTQNKIVTVLDKANSLYLRRQKSIELLDELIYAQYFEMFGVNNPEFRFWGEVEIQSVSNDNKGSLRTGPFGSSLKHSEFSEAGDVAVLGIDNAVDNIFKWKKKRFITNKKYQAFKHYKVFPRDVIITIMGTVGRSAVIPNDIPKAINTKHLACITLDESKCNPYYLSYSIHSDPYIAFQMRSKNRGSIMKGLNLRVIKKLKVKNAPISLQNRFEKIYVEVRRKQEILNLSLTNISILFKSILSRAYSGQLNFDVSIELNSLLKEIDLLKPINDLKGVTQDIAYLQNLVDRLNERDFESKDLYDKAKHSVFQLLKSESRIEQKYQEDSKSLKLFVQ